MSLDVSLYEDGEEVYSANITHNLRRMAEEANIDEALWCGGEDVYMLAEQIIEPLRSGIIEMTIDPSRFKKFNAENGWGTYDAFLPWVANYLEACMMYPDAEIVVSK